MPAQFAINDPVSIKAAILSLEEQAWFYSALSEINLFTENRRQLFKIKSDDAEIQSIMVKMKFFPVDFLCNRPSATLGFKDSEWVMDQIFLKGMV